MKRGLGAGLLLGAVACGADPAAPGQHGGGAKGGAQGGEVATAGSGARTSSGGRNDGGTGGRGMGVNGGAGTSMSGDGGTPAAGNRAGSGGRAGAMSVEEGGAGESPVSGGGEGGATGEAGAPGGVSGGGTAGSGAAAGQGPVGEPCADEGATERCCAEGTRTCDHGSWSACQDAFVSAESCNGIDDDCNGQVDELGTFRCGVGACAVTVPACVDGALAMCSPLDPALEVDGCNGIDDDCDGAVDEDCATCVHVSPTGDDEAASASNGVTPFASVQAAIDFAASPTSVVKSVCVAAGAACGATFTYGSSADAALTMRDGVAVFGGYEATTWTRCSDSKTTLAPQATEGVYFPSTIHSTTVLDGFWLNAKGATVDGAHDVVLSRIFTESGGSGVTVMDGEAEVTGSEVGVAAYRSVVFLIDNCSGSSGSSGCSTSCVLNQAGLRGVGLYDSPGSHVEGNGICGGVGVSGAAAGIVVRDNDVSGQVVFGACSGDSPWFVGNQVNTYVAPALTVSGNCRPVIDSNGLTAQTSNLDDTSITTARCSADAGVASGCVFTNNGIVGGETNFGRVSSSGSAIGLVCSGGSCARIDHNVFSGLFSSVLSGGVRSAIGLQLEGGRVLIDGNEFSLGGLASGVANVTCTGAQVTNAESRIQNNFAGNLCLGRQSYFRPLASTGGRSQIFSNYFHGVTVGTVVDVHDEVRNNVLIGSRSGTALAGVYGLPADLDNNSITATSPAVLASASIGGTTIQVNTVEDLEALFGGAATGNIAVDCGGTYGKLAAGSACIGAGTPTGAPQFDFEGDLRDAQPDIGPDEYVP